MAEAANIVFVTCSNWWADVARTSSATKGFKIEAIPIQLTLSFTRHKQNDWQEIRMVLKWNQKLSCLRGQYYAYPKGIAYLVEALQELKVYSRNWKHWGNDIR